MIFRLDDYDLDYKIVSLAKDESTKQDLLKDEIDFIHVEEGKAVVYPEGKIYTIYKNGMESIDGKSNYDIFELWPDGRLFQRYDVLSIENFFYVTGKCNSNCIMCPSPDISRRNGEIHSSEEMIEFAKHIPISAKHLTITGGEPFMLGVDIFDFLDFLKKKFIYTEFLILTNGRIFSVWEYCKKLMDTIPDFTILGIPIHGSSACVHDYITRVDGSFVQTKRGIQNLLKLGIRIELRVVVSRLNIKDLSNIAKLIKEELEGVEYVSIMAMEMTGNAKKYQDDVWISYSEAFNGVRNAVKLLIESGIDVKLYNFPLCTVDKKFWTLCEKSISSDKVRYTEECNQCKQKDACGGVFAGTYLLEKDDLEPIL